MLQQDKLSNAISIILSQWTALRIAIEHSLAPESSMQELSQLVYEFFMTEKQVYWDELAGNFDEYFLETFNMELEDKSSDSISKHLCLLFSELKEGKEDEYAKIVAAGKKNVAVCEKDESSDSEDEMDEAMEVDVEPLAGPSEPVIDEDGFELVQRRRRR